MKTIITASGCIIFAIIATILIDYIKYRKTYNELKNLGFSKEEIEHFINMQ